VAIRPNRALVRQLRTLFHVGAIGDLSDSQLLERFTTRDGEAAECAFTALVQRHGPMVLRVCRNLVSDPHDAQDAYQATFLVLIQKARRLWVRNSLAPWLHRVAHRVASRTRASKGRRREHERRAAQSRPVLFAGASDRGEVMAILHEEIDRLPERLRIPVVLCDLEGLTHERAASSLGWPIGTLKSRLTRARELLRGRLSRRGLALPAGLLIAEATSRAAEAALWLPLLDSMTQAAVSLTTSRPAALGVISARVAQLTQEVQKTMLMTRFKIVSVVVLMAGSLAAAAAGVLAQQGTEADAAPAAEQPRSKRPSATPGAPAADAGSSPSYIRQSRTMIITRLEQEHRLARERLERTLRRVNSPNDPEVVRARKTVEALDELMARVDTLLLEAVDRYPTIFDFSVGASDAAAGATPQGQ
jgi:RNA polymerase sigma factor (sigma-70 family)